jgi:tetratricopeptide (TPR) repeat protein
MALQLKRDQLGRGICPRCDALLFEANETGIRFFHASFPEELQIVHLLIIGGADIHICEVCDAGIELHSPAFCLIDSLKRGLLYLPAEIGAWAAEVEKGCLQEWRQTGLPASSFEILSHPLKFRQKICHYIARIVVGLLNEVGTIASEQLATWVSKNAERITFEFLAGLWLLGQPGAPINVHKAARPPGLQLPPVEEMARSGVETVPDATQMSRDEAQAMMRERLQELVQMRLALLVDQLSQVPDFPSMPQKLRELIPAPVVTQELADRFGALAQSFKSKNELLYYVATAVHAALCQLGDISERGADWTLAFLAFEHHARTSNGVPPQWRATREFAAATVNVRTLWDQQVYWAQQGSATSGKEPKFAAQMKTLSDLVGELGFSEQFNLYAAERVIFDLQKVPEDKLDETLNFLAKTIHSNPDQLLITYRAIQQSLAKRDRARLRAFMQRLRQEAFDRGRDEDVIWLTARFSELFNQLGLAKTALAEVEHCFQLLRDAGRWNGTPAATRAMLLTEQGNAIRYQGKLELALERYNEIRSILPDDYHNRNVRVNERNRAIILRDLGRVGEAIDIFNRLLTAADRYDQPEIIHSIAVCYLVAGRTAEAIESLRTALQTIADEKRPPSDVELRIVLTFASLAVRSHDYLTGFEMAERAVDLSASAGSSFHRATATIMRAIAAIHLPNQDSAVPPLVEEALNEMQRLAEGDWLEATEPSMLLSLAQLVSILLWEIGEPEEAEQMLETAVKEVGADYTNQSWISWLTLAQLAQTQGKTGLARERLAIAHDLVMQQAGRVARTDDLFSYMGEKDALQDSLADSIIQAYRQKSVSIDDVCAIADFQASVLLSQQIVGEQEPIACGATNVGAGADRNAADAGVARSFSTLFAGDPSVAVLQFFKAGGKMFALLTRAAESNSASDGNDAPGYSTTLLDWNEPFDELVKLGNEAWNQLARTSPASTVNPLDQLEPWRKFANDLKDAVSRFVQTGDHLIIIPSALSGAPLQDVFARHHSISYAPSLRAAAALHRRRIATKEGGSSWRPREIHDFVIWKAGEPAANIAIFEKAAAELQKALQDVGCTYKASIGTEATREALRQAFASSSVRLSCHGRADPRNLRFDLLVAADGFLPPGQPTVMAEQLGERFLVGWQELSTLEKAPPIVFSAACGSGLASAVAGGERVGLERSLLRAGTLAYVAPQWPVPIANIQPLINKIIITYFANPNSTLSRVVWEIATAAIAAGMNERVARSVAVHGDWL